MTIYGPPHLQRRSLLKLGIASAVVLAVAGGAIALLQPGLQQGKLTAESRLIFTRAGQAILAGTLPADAGPNQIAINALLDRIDTFIGGTPDHVQAELSQLLGLLATAAGRRGVVGMSASWENASVSDVTAAGLPGAARHCVRLVFFRPGILGRAGLPRPQDSLTPDFRNGTTMYPQAHIRSLPPKGAHATLEAARREA
jgi:hypothetical protein